MQMLIKLLSRLSCLQTFAHKLCNRNVQLRSLKPFCQYANTRLSINYITIEMIKGNQSKHGPRNLNNTSTECALQIQCANIIPNQPKGANMDIRIANENRIKFHNIAPY